jgi:ABC-type uncharacterized transport system permease subunit
LPRVITGGNLGAAQAQGLPVGTLMVVSCAIAGACAGLAGFFEVAAIHGKANASLIAGYGFTGILVAFLARHNPLVIVPVAICSRRHRGLGRPCPAPHGPAGRNGSGAAGLIFVVILVSETFYGRFAIFQPEARRRHMTDEAVL